MPVLRRDYLAGAIFEPGCLDIDVHGLHQGYLKGLRARGGRIVTDAEVMAIGRDRGRWLASTRTDTFAAPVLVDAAGAWAE